MNGPLIMVDDNLIDIRLIERALNHAQLGVEFLAFSSGELFLKHVDAIRTGTQVAPTLVLLDINMPGMSGFDVLKHLRDHQLLNATPITIFSHSDRESDRAKAGKLGARFREKFVEREAAIQFLESVL